MRIKELQTKVSVQTPPAQVWYEPDATHNYMLGELVRMEDGTI